MKTLTKTISFDQAMKVFKNYVAKSETRPSLNNVSFDGEYFTATDTHVLLRLHKNFVSDVLVNNTFLYNPKTLQTDLYSQSSYPQTERLIPVYPDSQIILNKQSIKEFQDEVKVAKKLLVKKDGHISMSFTKDQLTIKTVEKIRENKNAKYIDLNEVSLNSMGINEGKEIELLVNVKYINNALTTVNKLSKLSNEPVELNFNGNMRPIHFKQEGAFDLIVMPIRMIN